MIGQKISHYNILEKLGEGGMGVVYKAHDTKLDRTVALKFLPPHLTQSEEDKQRFIREAKAAAALNHPNICTIYSVEEYEGRQFISMEYIDGGTLRQKSEIRDQRSGLPATENRQLTTIIDYALQIAKALAGAHEKGIVHRDIKPDNIMVTTQGVVKVMDFGLAKLRGSINLTKSGSTLGTVPYMSPEQIQGGELDRRSDIFSYGVVLYQLLTGVLPFRGEHEAALLYSIVNENPRPISDLRPEVPSAFQYMIERSLEKDPNDRYHSMDEIITELQRIEKKTSRISIPVTPDKDSGKSAQPVKESNRVRNRRPIIPISIGLALITLAFLSYLYLGSPRDSLNLSPNRIAVMVFENLTGDPTLDPIGRMAADWITQGLTQTGLVEIVPSTSVFAVTRDMESEGVSAVSAGIKFIAQVTGAKFVISGTYYKIGTQIQLQAQITDVETDKLLFVTDLVAGSIDNPSESIELLRQWIMGALAVKFDDRLSLYSDITKVPTTYEAYRHFIVGVELNSERDLIGAASAFNRAIEIDPDYITSYVYLAVNYLELNELTKADSIVNTLQEKRDRLSPLEKALLDWIGGHLRGDRGRALQAARTAASYAPGTEATWALVNESLRSNRPHEALNAFESINPDIGIYKMWRDSYFNTLAVVYHRLEDYEKELGVAVEARRRFPELIAPRITEIRALTALGRLDEAEKLLNEILQHPAGLGSTPGGLLRITGIELHAHGYTEAAFNTFERALSWYRERPGEYEYFYAMTLYYARYWDEANAIFQRLSDNDPDNMDYRGYLGLIAARQGNRDDAVNYSQWLQKLDRPYLWGSNTLWCARISAQLGEQAEAVALLREAFRQGAFHGLWLHNDFDLEPLRNYQPFRELLTPRG